MVRDALSDHAQKPASMNLKNRFVGAGFFYCLFLEGDIMAYEEMTRVESNQLTPNSGSIYHNKIVTSGTSSDYILPIERVYAIAQHLIGDATIYITNDPPEIIRLGTAVWSAVEDDADINLGITGIRVESDNGEVTLRITVKTEKP